MRIRLSASFVGCPETENMVVEGTIHDVDIVSRELLVLVKAATVGADLQSAQSVEGDILDLDVPVTCPVFVNGERVKLRLLQPLDHVLVDFKKEGVRAIALLIEVRPEADRLRPAHQWSVLNG
jgi:hypothetical protein